MESKHSEPNRLWWQMGFAFVFSSAVLALVDQCAVSGTRIVSTVLIGRYGGPEGLGLYGMAFAVILVLQQASECLITRPFSVHFINLNAHRQSLYRGSILVHVCCLAVIAVLISSCTYFLFAFFGQQSSSLAQVTLGVALSIPGVLIWDFVRRVAFAELNVHRAVVLDLLLAIFQIGILALMGVTGILTFVTASIGIGSASFLAGLLMIGKIRTRYVFSSESISQDVQLNWKFGVWMFAGQFVAISQSYIVPWMLATRVGADQSGIVMACQTIILLSNPFLLGIANWLGPECVKTVNEGGMTALSRLTFRVTSFMCVVMLIFWVVVAWNGEALLLLLFGNRYQGHGQLVGLSGLSAVAFAISVGCTCGIAAAHRPHIILASSIVGVVSTTFFFFVLVQFFGLHGAVLSIGLGSIATAAFQIIGFLRLPQFITQVSK